MVHFIEGEHASLLARGFSEREREAPPNVAGLAAYLDELAIWSSRSRITGFETASDRVDLGVFDSVPLADDLAPGCSLVDVGSGNGLPGLVVAVLRPDITVTLVEPRAPRAAFLRTAAVAAGCVNTEVLRCRAEDLESGSTWDAAVSRAVFDPGKWLELATGLVEAGGWVYLMSAAGKVSHCPEALGVATSVRYRPRGDIAERTLVRYERK